MSLPALLAAKQLTGSREFATAIAGLDVKNRPSVERAALVAWALADRYWNERGYVDESIDQLAAVLPFAPDTHLLGALDAIGVWVVVKRGGPGSPTRRAPGPLLLRFATDELGGVSPPETADELRGVDPDASGGTPNHTGGGTPSTAETEGELRGVGDATQGGRGRTQGGQPSYTTSSTTSSTTTSGRKHPRHRRGEWHRSWMDLIAGELERIHKRPLSTASLQGIARDYRRLQADEGADAALDALNAAIEAIDQGAAIRSSLCNPGKLSEGDSDDTRGEWADDLWAPDVERGRDGSLRLADPWDRLAGDPDDDWEATGDEPF